MVRRSEHTRFPIFEDSLDNIIGVLYARDLIGVHEGTKTVGNIAQKKPIFINEGAVLERAYLSFLKSHHHLFIVQDEFGMVSGVITLEDIIEEIIKAEIVDESDQEVDLRKAAKLLAKRKKRKVA